MSLKFRFLLMLPVLLAVCPLRVALATTPICISGAEKVAKGVAFIPIEDRPLSRLNAPAKPWLEIEAEQHYFYIGLTPREMMLGASPKKQATLNAQLRELGRKELSALLKELKIPSAQFEMWPHYDDWGAHTWVIARYRENEQAPWKWLDTKNHTPTSKGGAADKPRAILPLHLNPQSARDADLLFNNQPKDLYQRPLFGNAIWLNPQKTEVAHAWLSPATLELEKDSLTVHGLQSLVIPPPSRFNGNSKTFIVDASKEKVSWPHEINFEKQERVSNHSSTLKSPLVSFGEDFTKNYQHDVSRFSGETPISDPQTQKRIDFQKLSSADAGNEITLLSRYLKKGYEKIGFGTKPGFTIEEQNFDWRGIPQSNLILKIKGSLPPSRNRPVILSDHIDKAISEDIYESENKRVTTPGADDNGTATAALRGAASIFVDRYKEKPPLHDIWIVHFTGEEFPTNCAGARHFVSELLKAKQDIGANINLDMLGHRLLADKTFQINPAYSPGSGAIAAEALGAAQSLGTDWQAVIRSPESKKSYYTQTDSAIFDIAGFPRF